MRDPIVNLSTLLITLLLCGCQEGNQSSGTYSTQYLTDVPFIEGYHTLDNGLASEILELKISDEMALVFQDLVDNDEKRITAISVGDYSEQWSLSEAFQEYGVRGFSDGRWSSNSMIRNGSILTTDRNLVYYIETETGKTASKHQLDYTIGNLYGTKDYVATVS